VKQPRIRVLWESESDFIRATTPPQRLYVKRGYIPDARGITYRECFVEEGACVVLDDDLVMHFTKQLRAE
jgi:hypothetical protein